MCGIYGTTLRYSNDVVSRKMDRISFRGPDYTAIKRYNDVLFAHNRLAIIDLDPRSNQPFSYFHVHIVFNGEIYNYQEIRRALEKKHYQFTTSSDTEVICAAYLEYGEDCVKHFNGMFAFVIYDTANGELFGARDRFGKKPFYYTHVGRSFEFASQPAQINIGKNLSIDDTAIAEYLVWNYIPEPKSIYKGVKKLPAAHYFKYDLNSGGLQIIKYWDLDFDGKNKFEGSYQDAKNQLADLLNDAVKIRMFADVPLGVFLSGGIDSSLVLALASNQANQLKTFSIKFNESGFDESIYAEKVANYLGAEHHTIECNYNEGLGLIENLPKYYDEPFADSSAIPSMLLSKYTKDRVTVALSGDAGDEAFLGYQRYKWIKKRQWIFKLPLSVRKNLAVLIGTSATNRYKLISRGISMPEIEHLYVKVLNNLEDSWILNPDIALNSSHMIPFMHSSKPLLERVSDFDIKTYLNGDINTKIDRACMAFSLESRSPLMDYRVIEFSRTLPVHFKYQLNNQKRILKDLLFDYVPSSYFNRPKAGFTMPFRSWFRSELKEYVMDKLSKRELENIPGIDVYKTLELITEHMSGKSDRYRVIWKLLVLSQWLNKQNQIPAHLDARVL